MGDPTGASARRAGHFDRETGKVHLVGGGIASLAAAAFFIRDGGIPGENITIHEELPEIGGSLDASGSAKDGYVMRGGRMFESKYVCTFGLFDSIPTLDGSQTVTGEILQWNRTLRTSSNSRLVRGGRRQTAPAFGLHERHILTIEKLVLEPEWMAGTTRISDQFDAAFFLTDFWYMWCTTFAFQPWHSAAEFRRYLGRFAHMVAGFERLEGIMRTPYNQFDSLVRPLRKWLDERGVRFETETRVNNLEFDERDGIWNVVRVFTEGRAGPREIIIGRDDAVLVTLGSMTDASSLGAMDRAPVLGTKRDGGAWYLWENIARDRLDFGRPAAFSDRIDESKWVSFTTTLRDPTLLRLAHDLTGNVPGEGGLVTFPDSRWLLSIVIPYQPHFIGQPADVQVLWGYGLSVDNPGDFVARPMSQCTGREIMTEVLGHLGVHAEAAGILGNCTCIPCMMPFITSQFLTREPGDRPPVIPPHTGNLAFIGQFCEMPDDVVFTVEYSIRSAQLAVYSLLGLRRSPPPVYKGKLAPRVLLDAFLALHDIRV